MEIGVVIAWKLEARVGCASIKVGRERDLGQMMEIDGRGGGRDCGDVLGDGVGGLLLGGGIGGDVGTFWWGGDEEDSDGEARVVG